MNSSENWEMNLFTFPYWFIIDKINLNRIVSITIENCEWKFYPPYRTSPANELFTPQPQEALFLEGGMKKINPNFKIPKVSIYPLFNENGIGIYAFQGEEHESWNINRKDRKDIPVDTIRVDIKSNKKLNILKYFRKLMEILRVHTNQWWIGHLPYLLDNISIAQTVDHKGNSTADPPTIWSPSVFVSSFNEKIIDLDIWKAALSDLALNVEPLIYKSTLLDSMYYTSKGDTRRTILDIAQTLDTAVDINFLRIWNREKMGTPKNYSRGAFIKGIPPRTGTTFNSKTNIPLLISHITGKIVNRSFESEHLDDFLVIEEFWDKKRNPISHGANLSLNGTELSNYIKCVEKCINWLEEI
jgi:hypothetical protein